MHRQRSGPGECANTPEARPTQTWRSLWTSESLAHPRAPKVPATRLAKLEEKYRHELMDEDERLELLDTIQRLRRSLGL